MTVNSRQQRRRALAGALLAATLAVAACGGGEQVSRFTASRVIAFGDETSLIIDTNNDANGSKYSLNATVSATDPTRVCGLDPIWIQSVAAVYGLVFPQCNPAPTNVVTPANRIRATFGARAADLGAQIDAQAAESPLGSGDLVTVLIGQNDIIAEYQQYPAQSEAQLIANVEAEGAEVGRQVNRIADTGAKVLLATVVDLGGAPFGNNERLAHADTDRAALLTRMTARFNASLRATIVNDGRRVGLILLDELVSAIVKFPGVDGITNVTDPVCDLQKSSLTPPSILDCTDQTLVPNGSTTAYLWADDRHFGAVVHSVLAGLAVTRAQNNPF